jgi:hypothetical protein
MCVVRKLKTFTSSPACPRARRKAPTYTKNKHFDGAYDYLSQENQKPIYSSLNISENNMKIADMPQIPLGAPALFVPIKN